MPKESIFTDEWRECLRAHYMDVIRRNDQITLKSLVRVMHDTGFSDDDMAELRVRATMRAEDMPDNYVPDMHIFQVNADFSPSEEVVADQPLLETEPMPQEAVAEAVYDDRPETAEEEGAGEFTVEDNKDDPDAPQQLTLF